MSAKLEGSWCGLRRTVNSVTEALELVRIRISTLLGLSLANFHSILSVKSRWRVEDFNIQQG